LRIVAWNVNHRTRRRAVPPALPAAIRSLNPDIIVLTEYVVGPDHATFCNALEANGLLSQCHSAVQAGHNQVFIASRSTANVATLVPPDTLSHAVSNWLHPRLEDPLLDLVGLRVPMYKNAAERRSYWNWFETAIQRLVAQSSVIIGDLNTDPRRSGRPGSDHLKRLTSAGWQLPDPRGLGSYISTHGQFSRLDHALVSPSVIVKTAEYVASANAHLFIGAGSSFLSDHAPLVLNITVP
jgi:exonuclease III